MRRSNNPDPLEFKGLNHDFQWTRNWFRARNLNTFRKHIQPEWVGKKCTYLELGVFEAQSLTWMCQHVLTHPESIAVGIDPWLQTMKLDNEYMEGVMKRAQHNTSIFPNCRLIRAVSPVVLRRMLHKRREKEFSENSIDLCMIDGEHHALAVLDDANLVLKLVRPGGMMYFDDVENVSTKADHVKHGLEMFLEQSGDKVRFEWKHKFMEAYRVL